MTIDTSYGFTGGLVGHLLHGFNVSQMDTFIEEPFCTLNLKGLNTLIPTAQTPNPTGVLHGQA